MEYHVTVAGLLCARLGPLGGQFLGGGAALVGGASCAAYENQRARDELEPDCEAGRISRADYLERKRGIEQRSVIQ